MKKFFLLFFCLINFAHAKNVASINPIYQILLVISGDKNDNILIINPHNSEHNYHLKKKDIAAFIDAGLIFYIDDSLEVNFTKLINNFHLENSSYQLSKIKEIKLLQYRDSPKYLDPHIWLNPRNGIEIAKFMMQKLCSNNKDNCKKFQRNFEKFKQDIFKVEKVIQQRLSKIKVSQAVFYHDGYQYFEDYFNIRPAKVMTSDNATELNIRDMREFLNMVKKKKIKCVFGEALDEKNSALKLAQNHGLKFEVIDLIGLKEGKNNKERNGYASLLLDIMISLESCLS